MSLPHCQRRKLKRDAHVLRAGASPRRPAWSPTVGNSYMQYVNRSIGRFHSRSGCSSPKFAEDETSRGKGSVAPRSPPPESATHSSRRCSASSVGGRLRTGHRMAVRCQNRASQRTALRLRRRPMIDRVGVRMLCSGEVAVGKMSSRLWAADAAGATSLALQAQTFGSFFDAYVGEGARARVKRRL